MDKSNGWLMWMKNKCGTVKNEKVTQEVLANFFFICSDEFRWQTGSRSCDRKSYQFFLIYSCGVFDLDNLSKHKQRFYIYHRCMLYLTDPGAPGTFQTWRPQKSLISPSSGELSPLQCCALSEVIRCRSCSFHKLITVVSDSFKYNTGKQSLTFLFYPEVLCCCLTEKKRASRRLETRRSHGEERATTTLGPFFFFPKA